MASAAQEGSDFRSRTRRGLRLKDGVTVRFPAIMGVLNVTPDSFSDGGRFLDPDQAVEHALRMAREGAQIIDVGGESTRPGAAEVPADEECRRVLPVIRRLARRLDCPISIDTRKATVAERALAAGVAIVNDVSALTFDPGLGAVVARYKAAVVLMHMRGTPATMQRMTRYRDVVGEVAAHLARRAAAARAAGIAGLQNHSRPRHWICEKNESESEIDGSAAPPVPARVSGSGRRFAQEFGPSDCRRR